jgi:uncharacterized MAPEG superfamily protein
MSCELYILSASVVFGFVHVLLAAHSASVQRGYRWAAGARDEQVPALTGVAGRLARASVNFNETFPYFAAIVLAVQVAGANGTVSCWGAALYLAGRLLYLPLYAFGVYLVRSLAWNVATAGIVLLLVALLQR